MTQDELITELNPLFGEVYRLLLNSWSLEQKIKETNWANSNNDEKFKLAELSSIEALKREIILGLCRLDEDKKDKWSFHTAKNIVSKNNFSSKYTNDLSNKVKKFRASIGGFKNEHRNAYIAHQTKTKYHNQFGKSVTNFPEDLKKCILMALDLADHITETPVEFSSQFPDGSDSINLRLEFDR